MRDGGMVGGMVGGMASPCLDTDSALERSHLPGSTGLATQVEKPSGVLGKGISKVFKHCFKMFDINIPKSVVSLQRDQGLVVAPGSMKIPWGSL